MKPAFTTALAVLLIPALGAAQSVHPSRPVPPSAINFPMNMPLRLPGPTLPLPIMKIDLPGPALPAPPVILASAPAVKEADRPAAFDALKRLSRRAEEKPEQKDRRKGDDEAGRNVFDGTRPSEVFTLPEHDLERELGLR